MDESLRNLQPVFTGRTAEDEEISLYQNINKPEELHLLLPNQEMWKLSSGSRVSTWMDPVNNTMRVDIVSPEWTGQATGSRWDMLQHPFTL